MIYKFICSKCGERAEITMPISKYTATGHKCEKCGSELKRDVQDFCTASPRNVDGFCGVLKKN